MRQRNVSCPVTPVFFLTILFIADFGANCQLQTGSTVDKKLQKEVERSERKSLCIFCYSLFNYEDS